MSQEDRTMRNINDDPMTLGEIAADRAANADVMAPWQHPASPCPVCAGSAVVPGTRDLPCPTCAPGRNPIPQEG